MNRRVTGLAAWGGLALLIVIPAAEMLMRPAPEVSQANAETMALANTSDPASLPGPQPRATAPLVVAGDAPGVTPMGPIPLEVRLVGAIPVVKSGVQIAAETEARRQSEPSAAPARMEVANLVAPVPMPAEARPLGRDDRPMTRDTRYWQRDRADWERDPRPYVRPARASEVPDEEELANDPEYQELLRRIERERNVEAALAEASRPGRRRPLVTFFLGR